MASGPSSASGCSSGKKNEISRIALAAESDPCVAFWVPSVPYSARKLHAPTPASSQKADRCAWPACHPDCSCALDSGSQTVCKEINEFVRHLVASHSLQASLRILPALKRKLNRTACQHNCCLSKLASLSSPNVYVSGIGTALN